MKENPRILVVDDEEVLANFVAKILAEDKDANYDVAVATTGEEGVKVFTDNPSDLLLVDIRLPEMDGIEVLRRVKEVDQDVQVVMITAYASLETAVGALREGAYDYVIKPFEAEQMKSVVRHALERRSLLIQRNELIDSLSEANERLNEAHKKLEQKKALVDKELEERIGELTRLNELATKLSSELDLRNLLENTPGSACAVMRADAGAVVFKEGREFLVKGSFQLDNVLPRGMRLPGSQQPFASVFETGNPETAADWQPQGAEEGIAHLACVLLRGVKGGGFGALCVARKTQPFAHKELELLSTVASAAAIAFQNALSFDSLQRSSLESLLSLLLVQEAKHPSIRGHSERVAELAVNVAKKLNLSEQEVRMVRFSCLLHDLGKVGLRDELLTKSELSEEELAELRESQTMGEKIISPIKFLAPAKNMVHHQGESYDGTGHPEGLAGEKIPIGARILAVVNFYDEAISGVLEGKNLSVGEAVAQLKSLSGTQFCPKVVDVLIEVLKEGD